MGMLPKDEKNQVTIPAEVETNNQKTIKIIEE